MNAHDAPCVVLLEDDPLARFGQEVLLRDWGFHVVADNTRAGLLKSLGEADVQVAAIIADYNLGGEDTGVDIARHLAESSSRPIPTVIMSASHGRSSSAAARKFGFTFLPKPIDPEDLHAWLTEATGLPE